MNIGIFGGRLGRDAEMHTMRGTGDPVLNFSVAVDIGTRDNPKTQWVECALFGKRAEALQKYLVKGVKVTVTGRVSLEQFTSTKDGQTKTSMKLSVNEIDMHLPPKDGQGSATHSAGSANRSASPEGALDEDDSVPF